MSCRAILKLIRFDLPEEIWDSGRERERRRGRTRKLDGYVEEMRRMTGLEPRVLVSTKEYKKVLPTYFA